MKRKSLVSVLLLSSLLVSSPVLVSCGGGGGGTSVTDGGTGGGTTTTQTYLAYAGSVYIIDPSNPSTPTDISAKPINGAEFLFSGTYNGSSRSFSDLHRHSIYWIEENDGDTTTVNGGNIYKLSMIKGSSTPSPVQISSINDACDFVNSEDDFINGKRYMVVKTAGADNICSTLDDELYFIHSGMSSADAPVSLADKSILTSTATGGISNPVIDGFLVDDQTNRVIQKCDTNLSNCTDVGSYTTSVRYLEDNPVNGDNYLCIDGSLYRFDGTNLSSVGSISCANFWSVVADDTALYAKDSANIVKIPFGSTALQVIYDGGDVSFISDMTNNYLIVKTTDDSVVAIRKDGTGTPVNITTGSSMTAFSDKLYFNEYDFVNNMVKACEWVEGTSTPSCVNNSYWAGFVLATSGNINISSGFGLPLYRMLRVDGVTWDNTLGVVGGTLKAVNPSDGSTTDMGTVPSTFRLMGFGLGNYLLLTGYDANNDTTDVFFVDLSQQNSLQNLTNTPAKTEYPIF